MITVSGGRSSAMMARHIQTSPKYQNYEKLYVFCNTGMERPATIDFLKNIEKYWGIDIVKIEGQYSTEMGVGVGYKIVNWEQLNMTAEPFLGAIRHKNKGIFTGLPSQGAPYCSEMLKTLPAKKLGVDVFGKKYKTAIGYRKEDVPKRISPEQIRIEKNKIFPLLTDFRKPIDKIELSYWWEKQGFQLGIHSNLGNCELCWKKSKKNIIKDIRYGTRFIDWYAEREKEYDNTSFRKNLSIRDMVAMAKQPYTPEIKFSKQ